MIVLIAGLPGTGKSTLARELASRIGGVVLDKDEIRSALFVEQDIEYSTEQDDFCQQVMLETAAYLLRKTPARMVFLDGRPFSRRSQIEHVVEAARSMGQPWRILQCICSDESARQRLEEQAAAGEHPARNRDYRLYLEIKARFDEITMPKTVIDTDEPFEVSAQKALAALK
jgi:predicted kinase